MPPQRAHAAEMPGGKGPRVTKVTGPGEVKSSESSGGPRPTAGQPASHTPSGKFAKGNRLGPGRPKGSKDTRPRRGSIKATYDELFDTREGHRLMLDALEAGLKDKTRALGYLKLEDLGADGPDATAGRGGHLTLHIYGDNDGPEKAREMHGLPPLARRAGGTGDSGETP